MMLLCFGAGFLIFGISNMYRDTMSDFELGFCEGIALVFIIVGFTYFGCQINNYKNPLKTYSKKKR